MMKSGFILLFIVSVASAQVATKCDKLKMPKSCTCYESASQLICSDPPNEEKLDIELISSTNPIHLKKIIFQLKELVNLQHFSEKHYEELTADSLVIDIETPTAAEKKDPRNSMLLEELLRIAVKSFQFKVRETSNDRLALNAYDLEGAKLNLLSLENVKLNELNLNDITKFPNLVHIELKNVELVSQSSDQIDIKMDTLTRLTLNNVKGLGKAVAIQNGKCNPAVIKYIEYRDNKDVADQEFSFKNLRLADKNCKYHIDLSGSTLKETLLMEQIADLKTIQPGQLYLVMHKVSQVCTKCLHKLATDQSKSGGYFHSIQCSDSKAAAPNKVIKGKYLAEIPTTAPAPADDPDYTKVIAALSDADPTDC